MESIHAERVYQVLRDRIMQSQMEPGLPISAHELAAELGVSRTPVREALFNLEREGLVERNSARRLFPVAISYSRAADIYVARAANEGMATRLAVAMATREDVDRLRGIVHAALESIEQGKLDTVVDLNDEFHNGILALGANEYITQTIWRSRALIHRYRKATITAFGRAQSSLDEHLRICDFIEAGDAERAEAAMRDHVFSAGRAFLDGMETFLGADKQTPSSTTIKNYRHTLDQAPAAKKR